MCKFDHKRLKLCDDEKCDSCFEKSFASHPKAKYWADDNPITPRQVLKNAQKKYAFNCKCGHRFENFLRYINSKNQWCPYCCVPHNQLCHDENCEDCFKKSFASHPKAKYWSKENNVTPRQVSKGTPKKYDFDCDICNHTFKSALNHVINDKASRWCPYCGHSKLCNKEDCEFCFRNSFASHSKAKYWSNENAITPRNVFKNKNKKFLFDCDICGHIFEISLGSVTSGGGWCSYCSHDKLCDNEDCDFCFGNSFASHPKAKYWSDQNKERPRDVFKGTKDKYFFDCKCGHTFKSCLGSISAKNKNSWCPYCSAHAIILCDDEDCQRCFKNSFASHPRAKYWSTKNELTPRQVFKSTPSKYVFDCPDCNNEYTANLGNISGGGTWCNCLLNKTETKLFNFLSSNYSCLIEKQKKFNWCRDKKELPFDFCIEEYNLLIELDGIQHFEQVSNWKDPSMIHECDLYKMQCANDNGYSIIRIFQEDVWKDKNNWEVKLKNMIQYYEDPVYIYIGKIYDTHTFL